jgi:hypothetical protein
MSCPGAETQNLETRNRSDPDGILETFRSTSPRPSSKRKSAVVDMPGSSKASPKSFKHRAGLFSLFRTKKGEGSGAEADVGEAPRLRSSKGKAPVSGSSVTRE